MATFDPVIEAINEHLATWSPGDAREAADGLGELALVAGALRDALDAIGTAQEDKPGLGSTVEALAEMARTAGRLETLASEHAEAFRTEHAFWLGDD
jgi:hypothetical protein